MIHILNVITALHNLMATGICSIELLLLLRRPYLHRLLSEFLALQAAVVCQNEAPKMCFYNQVTKIAGCQIIQRLKVEFWTPVDLFCILQQYLRFSDNEDKGLIIKFMVYYLGILKRYPWQFASISLVTFYLSF